MAPFLFYDVKISFLHSILNSSTRRSLDQAPPEIKMDPLETVGGVCMYCVFMHIRLFVDVSVC